jgi:hypothetical protein
VSDAATIRVRPVRSRHAALLITGLATFACAVVATLPLGAITTGLAWAGILTWMGNRMYVVALRRGGRAVREVVLQGDLRIAVTTGAGAAADGHVRPETYVGARITSIVWRPDGARFSQAILLLPDMLPHDDFRRLRVLLRYGRSDVTQADPASHA